jgi:catechol 2,3-dioxygenase-like lactoylglutathione lyase family enzyme
MVNMKQFHHIAISVGSMNKSCDFYVKNFGFIVKKQFDMPAGGRIVHLQQPEGCFILELIMDKKNKTINNKSFHLAFMVENFDQFLLQVKANGINIISGPSKIGNENIVFVSDPDDFMIEINDNL